MASQPVRQLAEEIVASRETEIPLKLLKLKEILKLDDLTKKIKYDIYNLDLLEALIVSFKHEYNTMKNGWNVAIELVKIFCLCTTDFGSSDKQYQNVLLPTGAENILILAKKLQERYLKSKAFSDEFLNLFKIVMKEYAKINVNNSFIAMKSLKSQRLAQLLLSDEHNTSAAVMLAIRDILQIKRNLVTQLDEKTLHYILDEIVYKLAMSEMNEVGSAAFQLLLTMCQMDPNLIRLIYRRFKGLNLMIEKWQGKGVEKELNEFLKIWDGATKITPGDENLEKKAILIQKTWRGHNSRKRLENADKAFKKLHQAFRAKKEVEEEKRLRKIAADELKFQLLLEHRRRQRRGKLETIAIIEILPPTQIERYLEKQREFSVRIIQANFRGYLQRKKLNMNMKQKIRQKAAVCIQRATRRYLERMRRRRQMPAFYSRPPLEPEKREFLLDKIRKHLDSLPPHPRDEKGVNELHERAQRAFHEYVLQQRAMRKQQSQIQILLALSKNDADIILDHPKLSEATEEDVNNYFSYKSAPIMLAAKQAHKKMLKKHRAQWWELLNDDSDSDGELYDADFDELTNSIKNLNFNANTDNYYSDADRFNAERNLGSAKMVSTGPTLQIHHSIPKRELNQLKTTNIRKSVTRMMTMAPTQSNVWNAAPFDNLSSAVLEKLEHLPSTTNNKPPYNTSEVVEEIIIRRTMFSSTTKP